jgi:hypothetical protein
LLASPKKGQTDSIPHYLIPLSGINPLCASVSLGEAGGEKLITTAKSQRTQSKEMVLLALPKRDRAEEMKIKGSRIIGDVSSYCPRFSFLPPVSLKTFPALQTQVTQVKLNIFTAKTQSAQRKTV